MKISKIGMTGAGKMGQGITVSALMAGLEVVLLDMNDDILAGSRNIIKAQIEKLYMKNGKDLQEAAKLLEKLVTATDYSAFGDADLIIEAVPERIDIKNVTLAAIEKNCRPDAIIATNTSTFSITLLAGALKNPGRFSGMHFFLPPSKLVELTRGEETADETIASLMEVGIRLGKEPVEVKKDSPGFIANRVYTPLLLEAFRLCEEGVATPRDIDSAMKSTYLPIGPFELADIIGLDVLESSLEYYTEKLGQQWQPPKLMKELIKEGRLGKKTGHGIYDYK
ncbi:MAG: 3-hydroxyacyl-CoA dehydrogenase family protein [Clostridiales bacterium]|nr:3-hydroxyacyl-CoA dehydrogenase family protein [Clostridiales bacterium]